MSDKIRMLAEKLCNIRPVYFEDAERILRAELEPLLEKAEKHVVINAEATLQALAAELQHWHSMERTPER